MERMVPTSFLESENLIFNLHQGDFTTANNMAEGINAMFGPDVAVPLDSSSVRVRAPADPAQRVSFLSLIENIEVDAASPSAKVIVNARTGTVVIGGNVRVTPAAVSHGKMTVKITENTIVTPNGQNVTTNGTAPGASTDVGGDAALRDEVAVDLGGAARGLAERRVGAEDVIVENFTALGAASVGKGGGAR